MEDKLGAALEKVKKGVTVEISTSEGNAITIRKSGVNKYKVTDKDGHKQPVYLNYTKVKELLEKFNKFYTD